MSDSADAPPNLIATTLRGSAYSVAASGVTLILGLVRSVWLARLVAPEAFGVVALVLFYVGLALQLRGLGLDDALIHRRDPSPALMRTYFSWRAGLDVLALGALAALAPLVQAAYPAMPTLSSVLLALVPGYLLANLAQMQETLVRKRLAFRRLAIVDVTSSLVMTTVSVYLAWRGFGLWALVAERLSGFATRFVILWLPLRVWTPRLGWDAASARWLWAFGKASWAASNLGYLLDHFDDFWVGTALGKEALGFYAKAYEFALYPRRVFANPLVTVLGPVFAAAQGDRRQLSQLFYRAAYFLLRSGLWIGGALALAMPELIRFVIGPAWAPMLWTFRLMAVYVVLDVMLVLVHTFLLALGQPDALRRVRLAQLAAFVPGVILGSRLWGRNGVAMAADVMLVIGIIGLLRPVRRLADFSLARLCAWPLVAAALAAGLGLWLEQGAAALSWGSLGLKLGAFTGTLALALVVAERDDLVRGLRWAWGMARARLQGAPCR